VNTPWYNVAVVVVWLASMTWLITQKLLPSMLVGEPPNYQRILEAQHHDPVVAWRLSCNGEEIGWAYSETTLLPGNLTTLNSHVFFERLPLERLLPKWFQGLLLPSGVGLRQLKLQMEVRTHLTFDPLHRLCQFDSRVRFPPLSDAMRIHGKADEGRLQLSIHYLDFSREFDVPLPRNVLFSESNSPQNKLPGLREGQTWTVQVYSPFANPSSPVEILQATVEGKEPVIWEDRIATAWVVVFRSEPGRTGSRTQVPKGRMWVLMDGTVIKQEVGLFDSRLVFSRMSPEVTRELAEKVAQLDSQSKGSEVGVRP